MLLVLLRVCCLANSLQQLLERRFLVFEGWKFRTRKSAGTAFRGVRYELDLARQGEHVRKETAA
jgi:hypothetical protein